MIARTFQDILAWKKAHELVLEVYRVTDQFPRKEDFILTSQLRRCAVSMASNIAEGFKKQSRKDSIHFYNIAEGSLEELKYQLLLSRDLGYITGDAYSRLHVRTEEVGRLLNGWIKSQKIQIT